jgi:DNA helicase-2/ATP-dependent DNA helicase PcrA
VVSFPDRYAGASIYKLTANYRSTPEILTLANRSIAKARRGFPKDLRAVRASGARPAVVACRDVYEQAEFVAQRILELRDEGLPLEEIGVLYRAHHHSLELQLELTRRNVPYIVRSGLRFFEQAHIKDVLAYLRIVHNPHDELAWKRVLRLASGVGSVTAEKTWLLVKARSNPIDALGDEAVLAQLPRRAAAALESLHDTLSALVEIGRDHPSEMVESVLRNGYERLLVATYDNADARIDDVRQLAAYALSFHGLEEFLSELSLLASFTAENVVQGAEPDEHVTLSSVHQAKGLEWRAVFVVWLCDGRFPSMPALRDPDGEEEERRLFYVACTRAKDELYLTFPLVHQPFERERVLVARSRFIDELGAHELPYDRWTLEPSPVLPTLPGTPSPAQLPEARGRNDDDVFE